MVGARIDHHVTDRQYEVDSVRGDYGEELPENVRASFGRGGIEAMPTFKWADGLGTEGGPFDQDGFRALEMAEYVCRRAAKCYIKEKQPGIGREQIQQVVDRAFGQRMGTKQHRTGETSRDPYGSLRKITKSY